MKLHVTEAGYRVPGIVRWPGHAQPGTTIRLRLGTTQAEVDEVEASKSLTGAAKTLCIPLVQPPMPEGTQCFTGNGKPAVSWALWGRSY